jgi:hypothetical protein
MYYKYEGFKGKRFFKMKETIDFPNNEVVIQVCLSPGTAKKGRANCIGVYIIRRLTLLGNYAFSNDLKKCSKKEYETALQKVLKIVTA